MRLLTIALLTATGVALAAPAMAQDVYVGAGPRGVGIGVDSGYHHNHYRDGYRERRIYTEGHSREGCRTTIIKRDGMTKKIRRCY